MESQHQLSPERWSYVTNLAGMNTVDQAKAEYVLALFDPGRMDFENQEGQDLGAARTLDKRDDAEGYRDSPAAQI